YKPRGILLPRTCPAAGFPFGAKFTFSNEQSTTANTVVHCGRLQEDGPGATHGVGSRRSKGKANHRAHGGRLARHR
ncbi:MAG: hypothetical protein FWD42_10565, partial [Solirubrobacterales bacterium]|nr:hypothetical protein [Solirubrobacterales bacterium]